MKVARLALRLVEVKALKSVGGYKGLNDQEREIASLNQRHVDTRIRGLVILINVRLGISAPQQYPFPD